MTTTDYLHALAAAAAAGAGAFLLMLPWRIAIEVKYRRQMRDLDRASTPPAE